MTYLRRKAGLIVGVDRNRELCKVAHRLGFEILQADARHLPFIQSAFDTTWACEIIEHTLSLDVFNEIERVTRRDIIATMPNPHGPYYWLDPEHVLNYGFRSLRRFFSLRRDWNYQVHGLGLTIPRRGFSRVLNSVADFTYDFPWFALTILIRGARRAQQKGFEPSRGADGT